MNVGHRRVNWSAESSERQRLEALLKAANGRRQSRVLDFEAVRATVDAALSNPNRFAWAHGGQADDMRSRTTLCLAAERDDAVVVGVAEVHAKNVVPSLGWPDLPKWDAFNDAANASLVARWARARRTDDRVALPLVDPDRSRPRASLSTLLDDIVAHPDDDRPRLVYADALSDRGDPRGEFIALQCADRATTSAAHRQREEELLAAHRAEWLRGVPEGLGVTCRFERGFVVEVVAQSADALKRLEDFVAREPVDSLVVPHAFDSQLAQFPRWVERVRALRVDAHSLSSGWREFLESRRFGRLTTLVVSGEKQVAAFARLVPSAFPRLVELGLTHSASPFFAQSLFHSKWFGALRSLNMSDDLLGFEDVQRLARLPALKLDELMLDGNRLGNDAAELLATTPNLVRRLRLLSLNRNRIGPQGAEALVRSTALPAQALLSLEKNHFGARFAARLLELRPNLRVSS